jgi:hypothetical protein
MSNADHYFKRNNIKKIYYFHVDHFEPTSLDNTRVVEDGVIDEFIDEMNKYDHSKKMSLFYRPTFTLCVNDRRMRDDRFGVEGDFVSFLWDKNTDKSVELLSLIDSKSEFGFGLHIHHEHFAECDSMSKQVRLMFVANDNSYSMDRARLRLIFNKSKEFMLKSLSPETDEYKQFESGGWLFIHGKWALNCSDLRVCRMEDEIQLLKLHGCDGDFSFPAGRRHCDPYIKAPFTISPTRGFRTYDYMSSAPRPIYSGSNVMSDSRFFIWNSKLEHPASSLDSNSGPISDNLASHEDCLTTLLEGSVRIDDMLFVKTYAHSLEGRFERGQGGPYPLAHPNVLRMFDTLETLCIKNNVELNYVTASEVYNIFKGIDDGTIKQD